MLVNFTFVGRFLPLLLAVLVFLFDDSNTFVQSNSIAKRSPSSSSDHGFSKLNHLLKRINAEAQFLMANSRMVAVNRGFGGGNSGGGESLTSHKQMITSSARRLRSLLRLADRHIAQRNYINGGVVKGRDGEEEEETSGKLVVDFDDYEEGGEEDGEERGEEEAAEEEVAEEAAEEEAAEEEAAEEAAESKESNSEEEEEYGDEEVNEDEESNDEEAETEAEE